ncbi:MAG: MFS transporter [Dongiaceae bacterium]
MSGSSWRELFRGERAIFVIVLNLGIGLHAIDVFVISTIMPEVIKDIGGISFYSWATMTYMVATIVGASCGGIVQIDLGPRRGYVLGALIFVIGTVGCAVSPSMALMLVARAIQGLGGGLIVSQSLSLIRLLFEDRLRTRMLALVSGVWGVASLLGPLVGGIFSELHWWRGAFWSTVPVILTFMILAWFSLPNADAQEEHRVPRLPWRRLLLLATSVIAIGTAGVLSGRLMPALLMLLAGALIWLTMRMDAAASQPLFPRGALSWFQPIGGAYWFFLMTSVTHTALGVYLPLVLQVEYGMPPLAAGYFNAIFALSWTTSSFAVAGFARRWLPVTVLGGAGLALIGMTALAFAIVGGTPLIVGICVAVTGVGVGTSNLHLTAATMAAARPGEETLTAASIPMVRSLGIALGSALAGLIANNAGIAQGVTPETVASAARWVISLATLSPLLMLVFGLRFITLQARQTRAKGTPGSSGT